MRDSQVLLDTNVTQSQQRPVNGRVTWRGVPINVAAHQPRGGAMQIVATDPVRAGDELVVLEPWDGVSVGDSLVAQAARIVGSVSAVAYKVSKPARRPRQPTAQVLAIA